MTLTRRNLLGLAGLATVAGLAGPPPPPRCAPARADLALVGATLIDVRTGRRHPDSTVRTAGDRIVAVGRTGEVRTAGVARVLDLRDLPLQLANGVTAVRGMWGHPWVHQWRADIEAGIRLGPRYTIGSQIIDGDPTLWSDPATRTPGAGPPASPALPAATAAGRGDGRGRRAAARRRRGRRQPARAAGGSAAARGRMRLRGLTCRFTRCTLVSTMRTLSDFVSNTLRARWRA